MSEDLRRKLRMLEEDYPGQPVYVQKTDLLEINHLRSRLGMPPVDERLHEIGVAAVAVEEATQPEPEVVPDHSEARAIYQAYLKKARELEVHRAYAMEVARATSGHGQTPVRPLATMGTNGGPLLCDHCRKPIVLEGGNFHGVTADVAWRRSPRDFTSWILGGMVVEIAINGTLRIYHGYPGQDASHCCNVAAREHKKARAGFVPGKGVEKHDLLLAFLEQEFPDMTGEDRLALLAKILDTMYSFDPGIGVNRPSMES